MNSPVSCDMCGKTFETTRYAQEHHRRVHGTNKYRCFHCNFAAPYKCTLKRHIETRHLRQNDKSKTLNTCNLCSAFQCSDRKSMIKHYVEVHDVNIERQFFTFHTQDDFENWKWQIERTDSTRFVRQRGIKKIHENKVQWLTCFRSGIFRSEGKGKRSLKRMGSNKIGGICPAYIKTFENVKTGGIRVEYVAQHVGHSQEMGRLSLSRKDKDEIARKLAANVPFDDVLDEIRGSLRGNDIDRLHLTTRKDLWNLARDYNLQGESFLRSDDGLNFQDWINTRQCDLDLVRFHKPQKCLAPNHPELNEEDFMLVIADNAQLDMLKKYGSKCICFDRTHDLSVCDFELTTLIVLDELNQGFPCAFLISNRCDSVIISLFVAELKKSLQTRIQTEVFMSDVAPEYYDGWCKEMPVPSHRIYCAWHVDRAWRKNLKDIRDLEKRVRAYKMIRALMEEPDENTFRTLFNDTMGVFKSDKDYTKFSIYFERNYSTTVKLWAFCYRKFCNENTDLYLEVIHNVIISLYMKGNKVKRLDKSIDALMRFTREKNDDQPGGKSHGENSAQMSPIRKRHLASLKMDCIISPFKDGWKISSQSHRDLYYIMTKHTNSCDCSFKCIDCDVCIHAFSCTCADSMKKFNFCKHIHRLISFLKVPPHEPSTSSVENVEENEMYVDAHEYTYSTDIGCDDVSS